jgi:mRNA interferase MazF
MAEFIKRFPEWIQVKSDLDKKDHLPPLFKEREVWWCSVGENVGVEISGKGAFFRRPVLVLRKLDSFTFIGAPLTRTFRVGSWYEQIMLRGRANTVIVGQARHFDHRRMDKIIGTITSDDFRKTYNSFLRLFSENRSPASSEAGGRGECQI